MHLSDFVMNCLVSMRTPIFEFASKGWEYAARIDSSYLWTNSDATDSTLTGSTTPIRCNTHNLVLSRSRESILNHLLANVRQNPSHAYRFLRSIIENDSPELLVDTYYHINIDRFFKDISNNTKKIIIFGAGPVGLFLANCLKIKCPSFDVYVIENRVISPGIKCHYSRNWATHLPVSLYRGNIDARVDYILHEAGDKKYVGGKIHLIESLLLLSSKEIGVKFLFDDIKIDNVINSSNNAIFFDASGGNLHIEAHEKISQNVKDIVVKVPEKNLALGHSSHGIQSQIDGDLNFYCKSKSAKIIPHIINNENPILASMIKITGLDANMFSKISEMIAKINHDNKFYIWKAHIQDGYNELLIIINISDAMFIKISNNIKENIKLNAIIKDHDLSRIFKMDSALYEFIVKSLEMHDGCTDNILIEPPFKWRPYIRDIFNYDFYINDRKIIPVGDSLFNGHPKVGNGLGSHLRMAAILSEQIANHTR